MRQLAFAACVAAAMLACVAAQQIVVPGCDANILPGPVQNMFIVVNKFGDGMKVHWKPPKGKACVTFYEVKVVENGPTPKIVGSGPAQTTELVAQVLKLTPGKEYLVTVTPFNRKGAGTAERQTIIPQKATDCERTPPAVKNLVAYPRDHKTLDVSWQPGDSCTDSAQVQAYEANTNKQVYSASVADSTTRVPGLKPKTAYRVVVTPMTGNRKGPATGADGATPCNKDEAPGSANGLYAKSIAPAGTIMLDIRGVSNDACVVEWEVVVRGGGKPVTATVKPADVLASPAATYRFNGEANKMYTFAVTAIGVGGKRGITSNIGPVKADSKTVLEVAPRGV